MEFTAGISIIPSQPERIDEGTIAAIGPTPALLLGAAQQDISPHAR